MEPRRMFLNKSLQRYSNININLHTMWTNLNSSKKTIRGETTFSK